MTTDSSSVLGCSQGFGNFMVPKCCCKSRSRQSCMFRFGEKSLWKSPQEPQSERAPNERETNAISFLITMGRMKTHLVIAASQTAVITCSANLGEVRRELKAAKNKAACTMIIMYSICYCEIGSFIVLHLFLHIRCWLEKSHQTINH